MRTRHKKFDNGKQIKRNGKKRITVCVTLFAGTN